jgi:hypothetical protein
MKIYLIPYTFKTYLSTEKIHSGIDISVMQSIKLLIQRGHDVRIFSAFGKLPEEYNPYIYMPNRTDDLKEYARKNREDIYQSLIMDIKNYQPDVVFSSHEIGTIYDKIDKILNLPIVYQTHIVPGFFPDLNNGNMLHDLSQDNMTIVAVSEYHRVKFEKYYTKKRDMWTFDSIKVGGIVSSSYCQEKYTAVKSDGVVRHVSALNPQKKTFAIHEYLAGSGIDSEVFTTSSYLSATNDTILNYGNKNLKKYGHKTRLDADRTDIMDSIAKSVCSFVGLASYDTYTITSLESMMQGTPLIVYGNTEGVHPALEMCDDVMKEKFISVIRTKEEFIAAVKKYQTYTLADRQELADRTFNRNSSEKFGKNLEMVLQNAITKARLSSDTISSLDSFF